MSDQKTEWRECYEYLWNNEDDVTIWQTKHHPYMHQGIPWGMEVEVAYNKTHDKWIKIIPGSGSFYELITKEEADELMRDGSKVTSEKRDGITTYTDPSNGKVTVFKMR